MNRDRGAAPALLVRHFNPSRRERTARTRTLALAVIVAVAASGAVLQEVRKPALPAGVEMAEAAPSAFDYFPG